MPTNYGTFDTSTRAHFPHSLNAEDMVDIKIKHCSLKYLLELGKRLKDNLIQNAAAVLIQNLIRKRQAKKLYQMKKVEVLLKTFENSESKYRGYIKKLRKCGAYPFENEEDSDTEDSDSEDDSESEEEDSDTEEDYDSQESEDDCPECEECEEFVNVIEITRKNAAKKIQRVVRSRKRKSNTMKEILQVMPVTLFTMIACLTSFTVKAVIL